MIRSFLFSSGMLPRYLFAVVLPAFLVLAYMGLVASEGYVSSAKLTIERETPAVAPDFAAGLLGLVGSSSNQVDALVVQAFVESPAMLRHLDAKFDLRGHFSSPEVDVFGRLSADASAEEMLDHYRSHLDVMVDETSYILEVEFRAYDRDFTREVLEEVVKHSEEFVNEVSQHLARQQLQFVEKEVERAHERLKKASRELVVLQREYNILSPEKETEAAGGIIAALLEELTRQKTTLKALSSYLNPSASELVSVRQRIAALEEQIAQERAKLVGGDEDGLNDVMLAYQDAEVAFQVAAEVYKTSIASLESTRLDTARKGTYLVSVSPPNQPDEALYPRVWYWTATAFVLMNLLYFVMSLIIATIRDHQE